MAYNNPYTAHYRRNGNCGCMPVTEKKEPTCSLKTVRRDMDFSTFPLAMCYVPWQKWGEVYNLHDGFTIGTIFPCLNKPFLGRGVR